MKQTNPTKVGKTIHPSKGNTETCAYNIHGNKVYKVTGQVSPKCSNKATDIKNTN